MTPQTQKMVEVFSSGGGTQSSCISALIIQERLPRPDLIVIVDTERERPAVWQYLDDIIRPAFAKVGLGVHRIKKSDYATCDIRSTSDATLLIPAFTNKSGNSGKLSNFCSHEWKTRVRDRWLREHGVKRRFQRTWIGFSLDEARRYHRLALGKEALKGWLRFPLIEDIPLRREQAIVEVERMGWPTPPRSACWMCPNQGDHEWRDLKANWPKEFQKAVDLEREVRLRDANAFLHNSCVPLDQVDFTQEPERFDDAAKCNSGMCFV